MTTTNIEAIQADARAMLAAYDAGEKAATSLKVGDVFTGAMPAAIAAGYERGTHGYSMFLSAYLAVIEKRFPRGVLVDARSNRVKEV